MGTPHQPRTRLSQPVAAVKAAEPLAGKAAHDGKPPKASKADGRQASNADANAPPREAGAEGESRNAVESEAIETEAVDAEAVDAEAVDAETIETSHAEAIETEAI